jgi:hypothetical protein
LEFLSHLSARARIVALLPLAALGVHDLRFHLAFGHDADHELATEGHAYLGALSPLCVLLAAGVAAELVVRFSRARSGGGDSRHPHALSRLAAAIALALVAIYVGQELLEGFLSSGHPGGLEGIFGDGGWWAIPLAGLFAWVIALFVHGAARAIALAARHRPVGPSRRRTARAFIRPAEIQLPRLSPFARSAPGRAPPGPALTP